MPFTCDDSSPTIFKSIGVTGTNTSLLTTGVFGVIKTVLALVWCFIVIDRFGRRGIVSDAPYTS